MGYLVKIKHNKKKHTALSNLLINCISDKSTLQILSLNNENTLQFSIF